LRHERGGAQVNGHTQACARMEFKGRLIHQNGGVPLAEFNHQIVLKGTLAGKTPTGGKLFRTQTLTLRVVDCHLPFQHMHAATAATALPTAGKLHPLGKKQIAQSGSRWSSQLRLHRAEGDAMGGLSGHNL
jgi:hypothetical protein